MHEICLNARRAEEYRRELGNRGLSARLVGIEDEDEVKGVRE